MADGTQRNRSGRVLLREFLKSHKITKAAAGRALHVAGQTVTQWISGKRHPSPTHKEMIAKFTEGHVPEASWPESQEERLLDQVEAFRSSGTEG